jgi:hypothetical protein
MNIVEPVKSGMRSKRLGKITPILQHYVDEKKVAVLLPWSHDVARRFILKQSETPMSLPEGL